MTLEIWAVYEHPSDYPDKFVARLWEASAAGDHATECVVTGSTLEGVRAALPRGLHRIPRHANDDPRIVECWL
jgi:hypothetical protein